MAQYYLIFYQCSRCSYKNLRRSQIDGIVANDQNLVLQNKLVWGLVYWSVFEGSQYKQINSNITKHKEILLETRKGDFGILSTRNQKPKHYEFSSVTGVSVQLIFAWETHVEFHDYFILTHLFSQKS